MSEITNQIFKNDKLKRVLYFLSIFVAIPFGVEFFFQGLSGEWILTIDYITIPQPFSSILLMILGIFLAIGWPILAINMVTFVLTINQANFNEKTLLKNNTIEWNQIKKVVQYKKKRSGLSRLVLYLSNGQKTTLDMKNFSKQNKLDIVTLFKNHTA